MRRQTPKVLANGSTAAWVGATIWGIDTGLMWTTFRVSAATWVVLLSAVVGLAPLWLGVVYGSGFVASLAVATYLLPAEHIGRVGSTYAKTGAQVFQVSLATVMMVFAYVSFVA